MKKIVSLLLVTILVLSVLCFTGCGAINKSEVSILWSGEGEVKVPDSLINSMERAMYIKNISYKHYGANGDAEKQVNQAKEALNGGCAVLLVELVADNSLELLGSQLAAQEIVNAAKEKNVPVIFFNCKVSDTILESYDKCVSVGADSDTIADVQGTLIADYIKDNYGEELDKNEDLKISFAAFGTGLISNEAVNKANELLATDDYKVSVGFFKKANVSIEFYDESNKLNILSPIGAGEIMTAIMENDENAVELIITESDLVAFDVLLALQEKDYNTDKLATRFIPIIAVGNTVDYKAYVLEGKPENSDELKAYYEANKYLVDLTAVEEEDLDEMIYTTINVIGDGRLGGTVLEDSDAISIAVATVTRNFIKGNDTFKDAVPKVGKDEPAQVVIDGSVVKVRYTSVSN